MTTSLTQSIGARDSVDTTTLLYQGAYNRSPDGGGLDYWVSRLESGQLGVDGLAASIVASPEFIALHNGQDLTQIVNSFYVNVLGRTADQAGLNYWVNSGQSVGNILLSIALSPESSLHNDAALHGYESAVSRDALPVGAPPLETFAVPDLTIQTHLPLDPQFLNANGDLFFGDGTTPAGGFSTVVDPDNSGLLFGVEVMPRQSVIPNGGTTAGYTPLSSMFDGKTFNVVYNVPSGPESSANGSQTNVPDRGAVNSHVTVGVDSNFDLASFLAAGNRISLSLDTDPTPAMKFITYDAVVDSDHGGTLDFVVPGTANGFTEFVGNAHTAEEAIQQNFVLPNAVADLTEGSQFDNILTAFNSAGQVTQELHWTMLLGPPGYSPADQLS